LQKIIPTFEKFAMKYQDNSISTVSSLEKLQDKQFVSETEFYRQQTLPTMLEHKSK